MAKQLKDILKGVQASKLSKGSLGKDPGVDYQPKAGDEARFADKHMVQKHENRAGNKDDVFNATNIKYALDDKKKEPRHGRKKGDDQDVYEAKETEDVKCNESAKGTKCPVHGMAECWSAKKINEDDKVPTPPARPKDLDKAPTPPERPKKKDDETQGGQLAKTGMRTFEEVELDEVLTKDQPAAEWIKDFVDSDNPKFEGKSDKKRKEMALAAYYSKQREKKN